MLVCAVEPYLSVYTWDVSGRMLEKLGIDDDSVLISYARRNDEKLFYADLGIEYMRKIER